MELESLGLRLYFQGLIGFLGFRVYGGFRGFGCRVQGLGLRVCSGFRGFGCRAQSFGLRVCLGFRGFGFRLRSWGFWILRHSGGGSGFIADVVAGSLNCTAPEELTRFLA